MNLKLTILPERYAVCQMKPNLNFVGNMQSGSFFSLTRTNDELSLVCIEDEAPKEARCEKGWRAFKVAGPMKFSLTGVLASLATPLADSGVGIFAISTYDTDYLLIKEKDLQHSVQVLRKVGHTILNKSTESSMNFE